MNEEKELNKWIAEKLFGLYVDGDMAQEVSDLCISDAKPIPNFLSDANEWEKVVDRLRDIGLDHHEGWEGSTYNLAFYSLKIDNSLPDVYVKTRREARSRALIEAKSYIEELLKEE